MEWAIPVTLPSYSLVTILLKTVGIFPGYYLTFDGMLSISLLLWNTSFLGHICATVGSVISVHISDVPSFPLVWYVTASRQVPRLHFPIIMYSLPKSLHVIYTASITTHTRSTTNFMPHFSSELGLSNQFDTFTWMSKKCLRCAMFKPNAPPPPRLSIFSMYLFSVIDLLSTCTAPSPPKLSLFVTYTSGLWNGYMHSSGCERVFTGIQGENKTFIYIYIFGHLKKIKVLSFTPIYILT